MLQPQIVGKDTSRPGVSTIEEKNAGRIDQIIRPVLDITFPRASCLIFVTLTSIFRD
jgi:hypothetical protein